MSAAREQVHSVLITLQRDVLLLPNAAVAEVLAYEALQTDATVAGPDWLAGHCAWNNLRVPVLRFERLNGGDGQASGTDQRRERMVIFHSLGRHLPGGHLALITQGYPHLVALNRTAVRSAPLRDGDQEAVVLARVRIANQEAVIPDLEGIEMALARLTVPGVGG